MCTVAQQLHALTQARLILATGERNYICHALNLVSVNDHTLLETTAKLRQFVLHNIGGYSTLGSYLMHQPDGSYLMHQPAGIRARLTADDPAVQLARLAWLDKMIHDLETLGRLTPEPTKENAL